MADPDLSEVAHRALSDWALTPISVEAVSHSENIVFRVAADDGRTYVLRMHRPGYHSYEELISEQDWTAALTSAGLDVPVPRHLQDGRPYGRVQVLGEERYVGVLEWVDGSTMGSLLETEFKTEFKTGPETGEDPSGARVRFAQLGKLLGALHNQASNWQPPPTFTRHCLDEDGLMGTAPFWGPFWAARALTATQQNDFLALRDRLYGILFQLPRESSQYSMIHADLHPGNVIVNGDRLHVIDFDDSGFGWHAYDLAVALKDYQNEPRFGDYRSALIRGYRSVRPLTDDTIAQIPLFLLIRALASIGWADARPELGHPDYVPGLARYVEEFAETVLARYV